jgi:hypothetical protein
MRKLVFVTSLFAGLVVATGITRAQSPRLLYGSSIGTDYYSPIAVVATSGVESHERAKFVFAAFTTNSYMSVKYWRDTRSELIPASEFNLIGEAPVFGIAATDLDSSHVETANFDEDGNINLQTWALDDPLPGGITLVNSGALGRGVASGGRNTIAITAVSSREFVIAYESANSQLVVQAFTVDYTNAAPVPLASQGLEGKGFPNPPYEIELSIAAIDANTVVTATGDTNYSLTVSTWGITPEGVTPEATYPVPGVVVSGTAIHAVAIAAGSTRTWERTRRHAVTPIVDNNGNREVIYWSFAANGDITEGSDTTYPYNPSDPGETPQVLASAACMLPTLVPISEFAEIRLPNDTVALGWYGETPVAENTPITTPGAAYNVYTVAAATAGYNFSFDRPEVFAYFVTGVETIPDEPADSTLTPPTLNLGIWRYPIRLPFYF